MRKDSLPRLARILAREAGWFKAQLATNATKNLQRTRDGLLRHVREVGKRSDLELIVATEKAIVAGDLEHYANSKGLVSNLDKARLSEDEKAIIEARRDNMLEAGKLYAQRQEKTLGVALQ
jgi:hypothetical protein